MSLPELTDDGRLPPGIHKATVAEIVDAFCSATPTRRVLEAPLRELVNVARAATAVALYVNGSFVSSKPDPGDIDAVIVLPGTFDTRSKEAERLRTLHQTFGFDIERVRHGDDEELNRLIHAFFAYDRDGRARGVVEVVL